MPLSLPFALLPLLQYRHYVWAWKVFRVLPVEVKILLKYVLFLLWRQLLRGFARFEAVWVITVWVAAIIARWSVVGIRSCVGWSGMSEWSVLWMASFGWIWFREGTGCLFIILMARFSEVVVTGSWLALLVGWPIASSIVQSFVSVVNGVYILERDLISVFTVFWLKV